jgi:hypothetical protein
MIPGMDKCVEHVGLMLGIICSNAVDPVSSKQGDYLVTEQCVSLDYLFDAITFKWKNYKPQHERC